MIAAVAGTFGVSVVSALLPVINTELYIVGLLAANQQVLWLAVGAAAAVGQMLGKTLYYCAGRGSLRLGSRFRRRIDPQRGSRWHARLETFQYTCTRHPAKAAAILLSSATGGLPPFGIMAVAAGTAKVSPIMFAATGLLGRATRFGALAAAPQLLSWLT